MFKNLVFWLYIWNPCTNFQKFCNNFIHLVPHTIHVHEFACTIAQSKVFFSLWVKSGILAKILHWFSFFVIARHRHGCSRHTASSKSYWQFWFIKIQSRTVCPISDRPMLCMSAIQHGVWGIKYISCQHLILSRLWSTNWSFCLEPTALCTS